MLKSAFIYLFLLIFYGTGTGSALPEEITTISPINGNNFNLKTYLNALLIETLDDDWQQMETLMNYTDRANSKEFTIIAYEAIWSKLKSNVTMLYSKNLFDVYSHVERNPNLMDEFKNVIKAEVLKESAKFFEASLYPNNQTEFQLANVALNYLNTSSNAVLSDIFSRVYENLLKTKNAINIINRLYILPLSTDELIVAYLAMSKRQDIYENVEAMDAIRENLKELTIRAKLSVEERILRKADTIRLFKANSATTPFYISQCEKLPYICFSKSNGTTTIIHVERFKFANELLYAFKIGNGYLTGENKIVLIKNEISHWNMEIDQAEAARIWNDYGSLCYEKETIKQCRVQNSYYEPVHEYPWLIELAN